MGSVEERAWMAMKRVCVSLTVHNCSRTLYVVKMAQRVLQDSGYETSGGRTYTKRWICCAPSLINTHTSAWLVHLLV